MSTQTLGNPSFNLAPTSKGHGRRQKSGLLVWLAAVLAPREPFPRARTSWTAGARYY